MLDGFGEATDRRRDHGTPVRHRFTGGDAVALPARGTDDDRRPLVVAAEFRRRHGTDGIGKQASQRPIADNDARDAHGRLRELAHALLHRQAADIEEVRRLVRVAHCLWSLDSRRDERDLARTETSREIGKHTRGADDHSRPSHEPAECPRCPPRELGVAPPELHDERLPRGERGERGRKPMRVHEIDGAGRTPSRAREREQEQRYCERLPWSSPQVAEDPVPVRDPEVCERRGRDDVDLDSGRPQMLDRVPHEHAGDVVRRARIRGRQDQDPHTRRCSNGPKTAGIATVSTAKT